MIEQFRHLTATDSHQAIKILSKPFVLKQVKN